jgi:hypothetical protein
MRAQLSRLLLVPVVALLVAGACARNVPVGGEQPETEAQPRATTTVRVENRSFDNIVVYVLSQSGMRRRLGEVSGTSTRVFEIPRNMIFGATPLRFQVDPIGSSRTPISQDIVVSEGDQVQLLVP